MSHSLFRVWVHVILGTKLREPILTEEIRAMLIPHLRATFEKNNCIVRIIDGVEDHLHALFLLSRTKSMAEIMKAVKGESAHWLNTQVFDGTFRWQVGYGGFSVSGHDVERVIRYIGNQKQHHRSVSNDQEFKMITQGEWSK